MTNTPDAGPGARVGIKSGGQVGVGRLGCRAQAGIMLRGYLLPLPNECADTMPLFLLRPHPSAGMRVVDAEYKLAKYIKIAMLFLEDDDAVSAETYIKKASSLLSTCKAGWAVLEPYALCLEGRGEELELELQL